MIAQAIRVGIITVMNGHVCKFNSEIKQAQLRAEADRLGCLSSTDVWTWYNQPHGDSIQS